MIDAVLRARDFTKIYTGQGVLPAEVRHEIYGTQLSIFLLSGEPIVVGVLFAIYFLLGGLLLIGYYSRVTAVVAFFFVISLDVRNPLVTSYADTMFRFLLFWGMFMPIGERFSIDALRRDRNPKQVYTGVAAPFVLLQMVFMYFGNGMNKLRMYPEEWLNGESMLMIFHYDSVTFLLGPYLREIEPLLHAGGVFWFALMLTSPLLLLFVGRSRYWFASLYFCGHLTLGLTVRIGAFPAVAPMGLLLFCQWEAWKDAQKVCRRLSLSTDWVIQRGIQVGSFLEKVLPDPDFSQLATGDPQTRRNLQVMGGVLVMAFILIIGGTMVVQNVQTVTGAHDEPVHEIQEDVEVVMGTLLVSQPDWMFYHGPADSDRYLVVAAETEGGEVLDVYNDRKLRFDRPYGEHNHRHLDTYRHRFFLFGLADVGHYHPADHALFDSHAEYICQTAPQEIDSEVTVLNMWMVEEEWSLKTVGDRDSYERTALPLNFYDCSGGDPVLIEEPPVELEPEVELPPKSELAEN